jgi:hypothetical protein
LRGSLEVGEQADLLEHVRGQVLRLVDDDDDAPPVAVRGEQPAVERVDHLLGAGPIRLVQAEAELLADGEQELGGGHARIENHRDIGVLRDARQQRAHDRGLAGAHLAGQLNETAGLVDAVEQVRQRLRVTLAQVQIARVRRDREGLFDEAEKARVHGGGDNTKLSRGADRSRRGRAAAGSHA